MTGPLDPSIMDLLRGSAMAPMLDKPIGQILSDMGVPALPQIPPAPPLPGMPPMPVIDIAALAKPLTDLAAAFGTGQFPSAAAPAAAPAPQNAPGGQQNAAAPAPPPVDPTQVMQAVSTGMQTVMQLGMSAVQLAMTLWQGMGADSAAAKQTAAQGDAGKLAEQSGQQKLILGQGATSVAIGGALMTGIIGKFTTTAALTAPFLGTPPGAAFLTEAAIESITEALAVTAKTRGEMTVHSVNMTRAGAKVPVTNAPTGVKSTEGLQQLMQLIQPLAQAASAGAQAASKLGPAASALSAPTAATPITDKAALEHLSAAHGGGGGAGGGGGIGGGIGGIGGGATPLSPFTGTRVASGVGPLSGTVGGFGTASGTGAPVSITPTSAASTAAGGPGMMPMGAGAAGAAGMGSRATSSDVEHQANLVTGAHGDEVVGPIEGVSVPVVGAAGQASEPPPDKELTL
ncbi:hypothetical protein ACWDSJ_05965 [Nocardia sp. NPDC003482]